MPFEVFYTKAKPEDEFGQEMRGDPTTLIAEQLAATYNRIKKAGGTIIASHVMAVEHFPAPRDVWFTVADMPDAALPEPQPPQ
jgi:hypothetical protein